ncbi:MAG: glycosyltransferase [Gemmatimonadetes bacterium]|nr:glycosyltransferase [Gemmatimonadota bacterium]
MTHESFISVIAPVHDPGSFLESFVETTGALLAHAHQYYEIIIVDDGSTLLDAARIRRLLAEHPNIRLLRLSRRFGEEQAILAGLDVALGDYVVTLSPGADPPELIPQFLAAARNGADVVLGVRMSRARDPWWLRGGAALFYGYIRRVLKLDIPANATHYRCLSRQAIHALAQLRRGSMRLRVFTTYMGFAPQFIAYEQVGATRSSHSRTPGEAVGTAMAIVMDNSPHPLRLVAGVGLAAALLNLCYAAYVLIVYLVRREVAPGWATLSLTSAAQFFALTLMVAVLCEYVGRLSTRLQDAPLFYVRGEETSTIMLDTRRRNVVSDAELPMNVVPGRPLPRPASE